MKWFTCVFIFASAFVLGIFTTSMFSAPLLFERQLEKLIPEVLTTSVEGLAEKPTGIRVMYAGLGRDTQTREPYLRFIVHNGLEDTIGYRAHIATAPFPTISVNGKNLPRPFYCGTGAAEFYISPDGSAEFHVSRYDFLGRPPHGELRAGFYLRSDSFREYSEITSEPFSLPQEFRALLTPASKNSTELIAEE